jgi:hypothetical protein
MFGLLCFILAVLASPFKSTTRLEAENAALRHQLIVLRRKLKGRALLTNNDRWFFIQMYRWSPINPGGLRRCSLHRWFGLLPADRPVRPVYSIRPAPNAQKGTGWVCENHPDRAWHDELGCMCNAGQPCRCNTAGRLALMSRTQSKFLSKKNISGDIKSAPALQAGTTFKRLNWFARPLRTEWLCTAFALRNPVGRGRAFHMESKKWKTPPKNKSFTGRTNCGSRPESPMAGTRNSIIKPNRSCGTPINPLRCGLPTTFNVLSHLRRLGPDPL